MARYQVQGPDGQMHVFEGPDGATPDQVIAVAQQTFGARQKIADQIANDPISQGARNFAKDMPLDEQLLAGAGAAFPMAWNGIKQLHGLIEPAVYAKNKVDDLQGQIDEAKKINAPLMATKGGMVGNIGGNVALTLPLGGLPGSGYKAASMMGGLIGALQPVASDESRAKNVLVGAVAGPTTLAIGRGIGTLYRTGKAALEPFYEAGKQAIIGRTLNSAAGEQAPAVVNRLQEAAQPFVGPSQGIQRTTMGELVPGSLPTVGQAAQNPGVAALERAAVATNPEVTNALSARMAAQNSARTQLLGDMAGSDGARDFAVANRDATADMLYGAARSAGINQRALTPDAQANISSFAARMPEEVLAKARKLAKINGTPMSDATSLDGLHWTKKALDSLIGSAKASGDSDLARAYTGLQSDLLKGMDKLSPDYAAARSVFADMSRPINQMDVASELTRKAVNPLSGQLQPSAFARNLNDATVARATGFPSATLENTLEPAQLNQLNSLLMDVQRSNAALNAGRGPGSDTVQKLAYSNMLAQSGAPTWLTRRAPVQIAGNLLGRGADLAYGRANQELGNALAQTMMDPATAAQVMQLAARRGIRLPESVLSRLAAQARVASIVPAVSMAEQR